MLVCENPDFKDQQKFSLKVVKKDLYEGPQNRQKLIFGETAIYVNRCEMISARYPDQGGRTFEISWEPKFPVNNFAGDNWKIAPSSTQ